MTGVTNSSSITTLDPGNGAYFQGALGSNYDGFILKFNSSLALQWATYYGGNGLDLSNTIVTDSLGNVFISGSSNSTDFPVQDAGNGAYFQSTRAGDNDIFICKFNNTGVRQWATYYGGNLADEGYSMTRDRSGNIFLTGKTASVNTFPVLNPGDSAYFQDTMTGTSDDIFILKFSNSGVRQWATHYGGSSDDYGYSVATDQNGNIFVSGLTTSSNFPLLNAGGSSYYQSTRSGTGDGFILKFDGVTTSVKETGVMPSGFVLDQNYPNPFSPGTKIRWSVPEAGHLSIKVYDVLGNEVASIVDEYKNAGSYEIDFDAGKLSSGVYLYKLQSGNSVQVRKMILAK